MSPKRRRRRVEPTDDWDQLELLCAWPEQARYELIRPIVLFDVPPAERARETGAASGRTLYRRTERFEEEGVESLFSSEGAKRRALPRWIRRAIAELKGEHPALNPNEISNIVYVRTGRRPDRKTVKRVLSEEPIPLRMVRRFEPYHEIPDPKERRRTVVVLHAEGWTVKAVAGYLRINRDTVYRTLKRWVEGGEEGLEDRSRGRPKGGGRPKKPMPFASSKRHEYWSVDVRYLDMVDEGLVGGAAYAITVIENHSRMVLASAVSPTQDLPAYLSVLHSAVARYGPPGALVTDSGSVFLANRARDIYGALGVAKHEIERGKPWQNYAEAAFGIQKRMADWHFAKAGSWAELVEAHERWVADYNAQDHFAHGGRDDGRRSPREVLGWLAEVRFLPEDLERAFFSVRFSRKLDASGYATFRRWRLYGEEALAGAEAALWLQEKTLMLEHAGETLSRYEVDLLPRSGKLREVRRPVLFETSLHRSRAQAGLFGLDEVLGDGWLKALKLGEYAPRRARRPQALQEALFPYLDAL